MTPPLPRRSGRPQSRKELLASLRPHQQDLAARLYDATFSGAIGLSDDETRRIVDVALTRARMALSS